MTFLPLPSHHTAEDIQPVAVFIARKIVSLKRSLATAQDAEERTELTAQLVMCSSALSLLQTAFLTEDAAFIDLAKEIFRGV
jgi:hypothetical protein